MTDAVVTQTTALRGTGLGRIPDARIMWFRALLVAAILWAAYLIDRFTFVFLDAWLLESLGFEQVFWTNFRAGALLFLWGAVGTALAIGAPAFLNPINPLVRRIVVLLAVIAGLAGGYLLAGQYQEFLLLFGGLPVGERDPVFGRDIGFFMFKLPALWTIWSALLIPLVLGLISSIVCSNLAYEAEGSWASRRPSLDLTLAAITKPGALVSLAAIGILAAAAIWLARYDFLWNVNDTAAFFNGADYVDVTGLFSYLNYYNLSALLVLIFTGLVIIGLLRVRAALRAGDSRESNSHLRRIGYVAVAIVAVDCAFAAIVGLRDSMLVAPNEPVIQLPFIQRHIEGTLKGWDLTNVEAVPFVPLGGNDPIPATEELLQSATLKNAPLWPGWVSYLERLLDPQHADRVLLTAGDATVYGPVREVFRAQQKLRTYYDFMDIDTVRYMLGGEKRLIVSAVRELPLFDPQDWVAHWGQRMLLFTHGHGLVMASAAGIRGDGDIQYLASGIPMTSAHPELLPDNPSVYYAHGAGPVMAVSNAEGISELDFPTDEDREQIIYPPDVNAGVPVDSFLKRLVIGWRSADTFDIWFSDLISGNTRIHYYRRPLDRLERIAPFLFLDSNVTAVVHDERIVWLVNAITTSDRYPYSWRWTLGDKSTDQHFEDRDVWLVNYARDSVKASIDAYTGDVKLYQIADEPVVNTWASIYPDLFTPGAEMPAGIRAHIQYPQELFHVQFDDLYILYHMRDPLTYFNLEDMWDDADEVKGPILGEGDAITFSIEPRHWIAETGDVLPQSSEPTQFLQSMVFTNEHALNLRAISAVYQDGADYGRKVALHVPKGQFFVGPEQADAIIDQDPEISEQISWWNRMGSEVIRGHTSTLVIGRELIYVEPLFILSAQLPVPQLKRISVVYRDFAAMGTTLPEALSRAMEKARQHQGQTLAAAPPPPQPPPPVGSNQQPSVPPQ